MRNRYLMFLSALCGLATIVWSGSSEARHFPHFKNAMDSFESPYFDPFLGKEVDAGGKIEAYADMIENANKIGYAFRIDGYVCDSSCTMKLGAKHVCTTPDSLFRFHGAVWGRNGTKVSPAGNRLMMKYYPEPIKNWVIQHKALLSRRFTVMKGSDAIALGVPACTGS